MKNSTFQQMTSVFFVVSVLLFVYKGLVFALLDSYVPLIISLTFVVYILLSRSKSSAAYRVAKKVWAYTILTWCVVRIVLAILITTTLNEGYLLDQINWCNLVLTLFFVATAYLLIAGSKDQQTLDN